MTREENLHWIDQEIQTWENECQSKHPIKEALYAARKALEQEPCEDAVSRKSVIAIIQNHWWNCRDIDKLVNELPPVTPQEPNTWSLDDAREDFMHDVYNELDFLPTNEEANRIIDIFDRVTSSIEQAPRWIPVTERVPTRKEYIANNGLFIVSDGNRTYAEYFDVYNSKKYFGEPTMSGFRVDRCAVAWMSLPKPYKEDKE